MNFSQSPEFKKELKAFSKKYRSLDQDLKSFEKVVEAVDQLEELHFFDNKKATKLHVSEKNEVIKARLDCSDLGNKNILRIIYTRNKQSNEVTFIELFSKNVKAREDVARVKECYS